MRPKFSTANNPDKFPKGYVFELTRIETTEVVEIFDQFNLKHSATTPKAFTEKGLYMLVTILKSERATQTTIAIIEAFAKIRERINTASNVRKSDDYDMAAWWRGGVVACLVYNF